MRALRSLIPRRGQSASVRAAVARWSTMRWAAVAVTDRRWAVALSASAIGMGLFIGIAIGPGVDRSQGTEAQTIAVATTDAGGGALATSPANPGAGDVASPATDSPAGGKPSPPQDTGSSPPLESTPVSPLPAADSPSLSTPSVSETTDGTSESTDETTTSADSEQTTTTEEEVELVIEGTVAHLNPFASSYALAAADGAITAVHAKQLPSPGTKLRVSARALANETYAAEGPAKHRGSANRTKLRGVVSYADPESGEYAVSQTGVSALVHADPGDGRPAAPPSVGTEVVVTATIGKPLAEVNAPPSRASTTTTPDQTVAPTVPPSPRRAEPCGGSPKPSQRREEVLTEVSRRVSAGFVAQTGVEGVVEAVCEESGRLLLSADDARESGAEITLRAGDESAIDLASLAPGDVVAANAAIDRKTRALELTAVARDDGIKRADDPELEQSERAD
jgi:hypothetical protein